MPDNWRRRRTAPVAIESPGIKADNRQLRHNRFARPAASNSRGMFKNYD
jgi:hypothetical protein